MFGFLGSGYHRDLHALTHSFPTRRSSDLLVDQVALSLVFGSSTREYAVEHVIEHADGVHQVADVARVAHHPGGCLGRHHHRSEEHTSELQSLMRISYAVLCLKKKNIPYTHN